ncbi:MAG: non-homologous end-joining DNA ligase [Xanthobacteraceae bacterium]|nr:non-homologous end-joining DNA ligase [Xanthobacteraceae bacterium]
MSAAGFVKPMLATLVDAPFDDPDWVFETKWDGFRLIARAAAGSATLYSRNGHDVTADYPSIAQALAACRTPMVVDGELVALDAHGVARFQLLQQARREPARLRYCAFDLLFLDGRDLRGLPLVERKTRLKAALPRGRAVVYSAHVPGSGVAAFRAAEAAGLEGVIGKRADSLYHSGRRSPDWVKLKTGLRQEAVIVGFTAPKRAREYFGALALAVRETAVDRAGRAKPGPGYRFAGRVGTGFSADDLAALHRRLVPLVQATPAVAVSAADARATTWVKPQLVCEVKFSEWTADGQMRHPVFMGLRQDKPARDVVRETADKAPQGPARRRAPRR